MPAPILRDLPDHFESDRLLIRCPRPGDGRLVFDSVCETLDALRAWDASLTWALAEPSVDASEQFCREGQVAWLARTGFPMLVFLKEGGAHVASSGLHAIDWTVPKGEIGYWCRHRFHGQGLMTEAVVAVAGFATMALGMRRLSVLTDEANTASRRVCERAGFTLEGTLRHERVSIDGTPRNTCLYARVT